MKKNEMKVYVGKYIKYSSNQTTRDNHGHWIGRVWPINDESDVVEINGCLHNIESIEVIEVIDIESAKPSGN